ncbi:hypothetical protein L2737_18760 [Shewanella electrodiphila]|uniref:Uncharacterized protein n=1 Tax=Shewanella electrodiphila TaxID=934143 RepID=A0ABT0KVC8_9GAMM|nr:hypothetical protein [Shewanella electrodiphila]MCL1047345.1 hypothetical protein [Shewanella electrodiphila]
MMISLFKAGLKPQSKIKMYKAIAIISLCIIAIVASVQTTGLTRAVIELLAFGGLIGLALAKPYIQTQASQDAE